MIPIVQPDSSADSFELEQLREPPSDAVRDLILEFNCMRDTNRLYDYILGTLQWREGLRLQEGDALVGSNLEYAASSAPKWKQIKGDSTEDSVGKSPPIYSNPYDSCCCS